MAADDQAAAASSSPPTGHQLELLDQEREPEAEAKMVGADATNANLKGDDEDGNQDAASVSTTTADLFPEDGGAEASSGSNPKQRDKLGLSITAPWGWDGSSYNDYDVVTVHGIRDDFRTAWTDTWGAWWVKDRLFQNLSIREVDYSYEIDATSTLYEPNGITQHAQRLVTEYAAARRALEDTETDRPIVWVCHDLGGTIVKEALYIAMHNPAKYGKIAILTTAIIFLGTPHRFQFPTDPEDQLCKLLLLPGPRIRDGIPTKVKELARQVTSINQRFLSTKIFDRAAIFNVFAQNAPESQKQKLQSLVGGNTVGIAGPGPVGRDEDDDAVDPVTPFPRYAHHLGHSFEAAGWYQHDGVDHAALVRGEPSGGWVSSLSELFNMDGFKLPLTVKYQILPFQAWLLSLAPPTRALDTPFDPVRPKPPFVTWIHEQGPYVAFSRPGRGPRLLHLHADGNPSLDVSSLSRLFYVDYDAHCTITPGHKSGRQPETTMVYFEFDQHDPRYSTISSLLLYLLNTLVWRFWQGSAELISAELAFLSQVHAWSLDDLFHLFSTFRRSRFSFATRRLSIFISCFDQCPAAQRQWFLERVLEEQSYSDSEYRLVLSTSGPDDLVIASFPDDARINLDACPALSGSRDRLTEELRSGLNALIARRPVYEDFRPQIESLLEQSDSAPYLARIILNWLCIHHRGRPRSEIADKIGRLSPPTPENIVRVFIACLAPELRTRAETVFNWVKHAAEPWSPESLTEALAVHELGGGAPSLDDLDVEGTMRETEDALGGIITQKGGDIRFSHASFYSVPEVGFEEGDMEATAKANSTIARACLRYLQLGCAQETLAKLSRVNLIPDGVPWATLVDAAVISHPRTSMAAYAVRFWHHHYEASGRFKPRELVDDLFAIKQTRAGWEVGFWLLSNPFTRMQRSYISTLPLFAMLGLEDLVQEKLRDERGRPGFEKDCWFAITEAARAGRKALVQQLLGEVSVDEEELPTALHWAAGRSDADILKLLLDRIPNLKTFRWPENMMHQAAAAGLDDLLAAMSLSGCDINEINEQYWGAPPAVIVVWRNRVSTMEFLLSSDFKPDLSIKDTSAGDTPLTTAADKGHPHMVEVLLQGGANFEAKNNAGEGPGTRALIKCNHKALNILLIKAPGDLRSGAERGALVLAAAIGSEECVRVLLAHQADPAAEWDGVTALYCAVVQNLPSITRLLLTQNPKPDMDKTPEGHLKLLICAVRTGNTELVSLLIDNGAEVNFVDSNLGDLSKTPLSQACAQGNLEMVKLLLARGANINYTGEKSDSPLLTALYKGRVQVARHLLHDATTDVKWAAGDGTTALHVACCQREFDISELLQRGAPINTHSTSYGTPLHAAARQGSQEAIDRLLGNDPKPDVDHVYEDGWHKDEVGLTPLQLACKYHFPKGVKALLNGGANPRFKNRNGNDAVDILLRAEFDSNDAVDCLRLLLSVPYNVSVDQIDEQGRTRLHGIQEKTPVSIVQLLLEAKAPLDVQDKEGHTPLSIAVSKGNEMVARYLVKQGASLNKTSPGFGSILHLAVSKGDVNMVKFLVASGADLETVDPEYGESLLYTALGIADDAKLKAMVRYLVDSAKVPINKPCGAQLSYPIIRAANLARTSYLTGTQILKFLIRRKAQLDVADSQGRRAVHHACASQWDDAIKALVAAGAKMDVKDELGRKPIHFAASIQSDVCFRYLTDTFKNTDINETDHDKWTPLMWAARSGSLDTLRRLLGANADVWARGCGSVPARDEWSALKLFHFSRRGGEVEAQQLQPKIRTRFGPDGKEKPEELDDAFRSVEAGDLKDAICNSCLVKIRGIQWKCIDCKDDVSLCFKCFGHHSVVHNREHEFEEIGPMYERRRSGTAWTLLPLENQSDDGEDDGLELALDDSIAQALAQETDGVEGAGDGAASPGVASPGEYLDFDLDGSDEEV